ncbi:hypothetical protein BDP27DRAFT_1326567 [Rhodocollybia butyracea]|uniref:Uncharacterized protein n=1 Tax=Rhodocollybia butyracea TaxID=206335 RepID=A0A9P5PSV0_9AGAR|nr:hypothetical protein BDP27DRAFT_1326567 [Rhodocollybia butyracea]
MDASSQGFISCKQTLMFPVIKIIDSTLTRQQPLSESVNIRNCHYRCEWYWEWCARARYQESRNCPPR